MSKILMKDRFTRKNHKKIFGILAIIFILFVILFYAAITKSGHWLVQNDEFKHAKWAIMLDGQTADLERNDYVATLLAEHKVDSVMILGRRIFREKSNADFYAEDFLKLGKFDKEVIFIARHDDPSTLSEANTVIPWIKLHKIDTVLLVTASPATYRAVRIFSKLTGDGTVYLSTDIHHHQYNADAWIFNRESRKSWLHEWAALFNSYFDLWGVDTLETADSTYESRIRSMADEETDEPIIDLQKLQAKKDPKEETLEKEEAEQEESPKEDSSKEEPLAADSTKKEVKEDSSKVEKTKK
ncbi:MAG: YdcF family protein [Fibrobacter sp.]|nr:YdcF family protein [Fibrobacter sp.]